MVDLYYVNLGLDLFTECLMSDDVKIFKRTLKSFLIANAFYSIDEYTSAKHV
jgi:hypothetical protein